MTITEAYERVMQAAAKGTGVVKVLADFEAAVRADERVKATAEVYERIGRVMIPRGSRES